MKIEIDLNDIFRDEDGNPEESLEQSIRRQVLEKLSGDLRKRLFSKLDEELSLAMKDQVHAALAEHMPSIIDDIMHMTYTPVDRYGSRKEPTNFRAELVKSIAENMKYEPKQWSSDENAFTKSVKSIVEQKTAAIREEITKQVDVNFKADAIKFAVEKLSERLGLKK